MVGNEKSAHATKTNRGEITIALKTSAPSPVTAIANSSTVHEAPKAPRARSKSNRNVAKRARETGETPPNAQQPSKKNRQRKNKSKNPLPIQNADKKGNTKAPVPPVEATPQSFGSGAGVNATSQPNVDLTKKSEKSVPPENPKSQLIGTGLAEAESEKQPQSNTDSDNVAGNESQDQGTYAAVASNLCAAVIDQRGSGSMTLLDQK